MAVLEAEGLSVEELAALKGKPAIYHCVSRVVDRRFVLGDAEREQFVASCGLTSAFCQVRVLAFCVMSNHFHILLEVPAPPEERGADWSDERLLEHLAGLYSEAQMGKLRWELEHYREQGNTAAAEAFRERYFRRMWDLSQFMKTLKQRFTRWFNRQHERQGDAVGGALQVGAGGGRARGADDGGLHRSESGAGGDGGGSEGLPLVFVWGGGGGEEALPRGPAARDVRGASGGDSAGRWRRRS